MRESRYAAMEARRESPAKERRTRDRRSASKPTRRKSSEREETIMRKSSSLSNISQPFTLTRVLTAKDYHSDDSAVGLDRTGSRYDIQPDEEDDESVDRYLDERYKGFRKGRFDDDEDSLPCRWTSFSGDEEELRTLSQSNDEQDWFPDEESRGDDSDHDSRDDKPSASFDGKDRDYRDNRDQYGKEEDSRYRRSSRGHQNKTPRKDESRYHASDRGQQIEPGREWKSEEPSYRKSRRRHQKESPRNEEISHRRSGRDYRNNSNPPEEDESSDGGSARDYEEEPSDRRRSHRKRQDESPRQEESSYRRIDRDYKEEDPNYRRKSKKHQKETPSRNQEAGYRTSDRDYRNDPPQDEDQKATPTRKQEAGHQRSDHDYRKDPSQDEESSNGQSDQGYMHEPIRNIRSLADSDLGDVDEDVDSVQVQQAPRVVRRSSRVRVITDKPNKNDWSRSHRASKDVSRVKQEKYDESSKVMLPSTSTRTAQRAGIAVATAAGTAAVVGVASRKKEKAHYSRSSRSGKAMTTSSTPIESEELTPMTTTQEEQNSLVEQEKSIPASPSKRIKVREQSGAKKEKIANEITGSHIKSPKAKRGAWSFRKGQASNNDIENDELEGKSRPFNLFRARSRGRERTPSLHVHTSPEVVEVNSQPPPLERARSAKRGSKAGVAEVTKVGSKSTTKVESKRYAVSTPKGMKSPRRNSTGRMVEEAAKATTAVSTPKGAKLIKRDYNERVVEVAESKAVAEISTPKEVKSQKRSSRGHVAKVEVTKSDPKVKSGPLSKFRKRSRSRGRKSVMNPEASSERVVEVPSDIDSLGADAATAVVESTENTQADNEGVVAVSSAEAALEANSTFFGFFRSFLAPEPTEDKSKSVHTEPEPPKEPAGLIQDFQNMSITDGMQDKPKSAALGKPTVGPSETPVTGPPKEPAGFFQDIQNMFITDNTHDQPKQDEPGERALDPTGTLPEEPKSPTERARAAAANAQLRNQPTDIFADDPNEATNEDCDCARAMYRSVKQLDDFLCSENFGFLDGKQVDNKTVGVSMMTTNTTGGFQLDTGDNMDIDKVASLMKRRRRNAPMPIKSITVPAAPGTGADVSVDSSVSLSEVLTRLASDPEAARNVQEEEAVPPKSKDAKKRVRFGKRRRNRPDP